jgi:hypothetical protein
MSDTPKRGWLSFSIRELMLVTVIVGLVLTLAYTKWLKDQGEGRYQMTYGNSQVFFLDTATGKIWVFNYGQFDPDWQEFNSPINGK